MATEGRRRRCGQNDMLILEAAARKNFLSRLLQEEMSSPSLEVCQRNLKCFQGGYRENSCSAKELDSLGATRSRSSPWGQMEVQSSESISSRQEAQVRGLGLAHGPGCPDLPFTTGTASLVVEQM